VDLLIFCTAFILQFVGHRIGDYFLQTHWQSLNKTSSKLARLKHCLVYSVTIALLILLAFDIKIFLLVFFITIAEHFWIDTRKPIVAWKSFLEKKIAKQKDFKTEDLPFFVLIEIDQTVHIMRIFLISILLAYISL
jgi:hypothetical protein